MLPPSKDKGKKEKPPLGILVNDVHAQLSSARVFAIAVPEDVEGVRKAFAQALEEEKNVCIAGGRHSMGGQPFAQDGVLIDTRKLARMLNFDAERGLIEVEAGCMWPQLLEYLRAMQRGREKPWTFSQKPAGADRMTLGGCVSANIHGRGLALAPFVDDIEALKVINHRGDLVPCSRAENRELFRLVVGGYGLFGVIYSVTLRLVPRRKLERVVEVRDVAVINEAFAERMREGYVVGDFVCSVDDASVDFLRRGVFTCYRPVPDETPPPPNQRELAAKERTELLYLAHADKAAAFSRYADFAFGTTGQLYWSDEQQMTPYPENYHRDIDRRMVSPNRASDPIAEVCCERAVLEPFMEDVRQLSRRERFEVVHASVRLIEPDRESYLAWARKPLACVTFHLHVEHTSTGTIRAGDAFRRLIDAGIKHGGSYYPTYHRYALRRQVDACLPQFRDFLLLKRKYDPQELFQSDWYRHYKRMYFGS